MKIGIMLRHLGQHGGGINNYTIYLLDELLKLNSPHEFVLIYNSSKFIGKYNHLSNVRELVIKTPSRLLWDQVGMLLAHRKEKFDVIFNPKYSLPVFARCPMVFVCHGLNSFVMPWGSERSDVIYRKYIYPLYAAKAKAIIAVSNTAKEHLIKFLNVSNNKIHTVYPGIPESFRHQPDKSTLEKIKQEYSLPDRFFLFVGQIYPPKNLGRILIAFSKVGPLLGIHLVIAGEHRFLSEKELSLIDQLGISEWVVKCGWVKQSSLPSLYALAEALVFPSLYESFGIPIVEAMSLGCPVVTSNRFGTSEVAGDAAILVNPEDITSIALGMVKAATDKKTVNELIIKGFERSYQFSWKKCAEETIQVLETTVKLPVRKFSINKTLKYMRRPEQLFAKSQAKKNIRDEIYTEHSDE